MAYVEENDECQNAILNVIIPNTEQLTKFFETIGIDASFAEKAANELQRGLHSKHHYENLAFLGDYATKLMVVEWCYRRFDVEPVSTLSHTTHELKSRAKSMGKVWEIGKLFINRNLTYNETDRLSHAAFGALAFADLHSAAKLLYETILKPLSDSVWLDDTEIYHTYCSKEEDTITHDIHYKYRARLILRKPLTVSISSGVHKDNQKYYKDHREARKAINKEMCRAAFEEYFTDNYELLVIERDSSEANSIYWIEDPEKEDPENESDLTVIKEIDTNEIVAAASGSGGESKFTVRKRFLKNSISDFKQHKREERIKANGDSEEETVRTPRLWSTVWKESKKILRAKTEEGCWVLLKTVRDELGDEINKAGLTDEELIAFLERHDCLGRFNFKQENGIWIGRMLYYHTGIDLTEDDTAYESLKLPEGVDVSQYVSENDIQLFMFGKWDMKDGFATSYMCYPLFPEDTIDRSIEYMNTEQNPVDKHIDHFSWDLSYLLSIGFTLRRIRESRFGKFCIITPHYNPQFCSKSGHIKIPLPEGEIWRHSGVGGKTLVDMERHAQIKRENTEVVKKLEEETSKKKKIKDEAEQCLKVLRQAVLDKRGEPCPSGSIGLSRIALDCQDPVEKTNIINQVKEVVEKAMLQYHVKIEWSYSTDGTYHVTLSSTIDPWLTQVLLPDKYSFSDYRFIKKSLTHEAIDREFNFERQEFLGDGVMDYCVAYDIFCISSQPGMPGNLRRVFTPTTQNGHTTDASCGLLPITQYVF